MKIRQVIATATAALVATSAHAAPVTFFGEDLSNSAPLAVHKNADAARNNFFANLNGVGTETFEGFATGAAAPLSIDFGNAGTATLLGSGSIYSGATSSNQYPISGTKFFRTTGTFNLAFSSPISAFGFYGTDIGDVAASLVLTLTGSNGVTTLAVPNVVNSTTADGSALYFGFYDTTNTYSAISFAGAGNDVFGFDDFSIGSRQAVAPTPGAVPEPASWAMMILGMGAVGFAMRRRRNVRTTVSYA